MIPYVISTWQHLDRQRRFGERWHESGMITFVPILDHEYTGGVPYWYRGSPQSYGCKIAHQRALTKAATAGAHALILEDDAIMTHDAMETIKEIERSVKFDIMLLGSMNRIPHSRYNNDSYSGNVNGHSFQRVRGAMGTHAMLIHQDMVVKTFNVAFRASRDLGDYYSTYLYPNVLTLAMTPSIIKQDTSLPSSIPDSYSKITVEW